MLIQESKLTTDYTAKFDEYLNHCCVVDFESSKQIMSRFMSGLRDDYRQELITRGIMTLEQAYKLVTDLDESRGSFFYRTDFMDSSKTTTASKPNYNLLFPAQSKPVSISSIVKLACLSSIKLTI